MESEEFIKTLIDDYGVSGFEWNLNEKIIKAFKPLVDQIEIDKLGNIICIKKGTNKKNPKKIMLAAHIDEIGLMVNGIEENGFIKFTNIGGIDPRTILGQEVIVHGRENLNGVIMCKAPHLQSPEESNKAIKMEDMTIDIGLKKESLDEVVSIGDFITIRRESIDLLNNRLSGKALDDRAGVGSLYDCLKTLNKLKHSEDVYIVLTVQEEVGTRGALTSTYKINPDIGIAVDVGFGNTPELDKADTLILGKGPGITLGGNIHPGLRKKIVSVADDFNIPHQVDITPGPTGTDGRAIQITREGIPTLVLSIPLRYMHTSVEVIDMKDVKDTGNLMAFFISQISAENLEEILCY